MRSVSFPTKGIRHGKVPKKLFRAVVAAGSGEAVRTFPARLYFFPAALASQLTGCDSLLLLRHEKRRTMCVFFRGGEGGIRTLEPLLTITRFPIVRARPATRLLRTKQYAIILSRAQTTATAISYHKRAVLSRDFCIFLPENLFLFRLPKANSAKKGELRPGDRILSDKKVGAAAFLAFFRRL